MFMVEMFLDIEKGVPFVTINKKSFNTVHWENVYVYCMT
jgi:hypothetical protein